MIKKIILTLVIIFICVSTSSCKNKYDTIDIYNKRSLIFDNIKIDTKEGYFYNRHEKFTVDSNTIGITIYFSKDEEDEWSNIK